jgi:hypothetical protein
MPELDAAALDRLTACVLAALANDEVVGPTTLTFLLTRYAATDRDDIAEALGLALAAAVDDQRPSLSLRQQAEWTRAFAAAAVMSNDSRIHEAVARGVQQIREQWRTPGRADTATKARAITACLHAVPVSHESNLLAASVDELERLVNDCYEPGAGMGDLDAQLSSASALLAAHILTGRVPYSMLADELMQLTWRGAWDAPAGGFLNKTDAADPKPFVANCDAALVCCRLAVLHRDPAYRTTAVTSSNADYLQLAGSTIASQSPRVHALGASAAPYGLALAEWLKLQ